MAALATLSITAYLAVCALTLLLALPSHAGTWDITYTQSGTWHYDSVASGVGQTTSQDGPWATLTPPYNTNGGGDSASQSLPGMNMVTTGTVIATIKWVPTPGQNDPPPPTLKLKQSAFARWHSIWGGPSPAPLPGGGLADDGLGDVDNNGLSHGSHLIQVDSSSGIVRLPCTLAAACPPAEWATITPYPDYPQYSQSYWTWYPDDVVVSYSVVQDNRAVTISANVDATYYKGNLDSTDPGSSFDVNGDLIFQRKQHVREPDGSMKVIPCILMILTKMVQYSAYQL